MGNDRDQSAVNLMRHLQLLKSDLAEFQQFSRGWAKSSKGHQLLGLLQRDFRQFEARVLALLTEIGHMDALRRQLTGGAVRRGERGPSSAENRKPPAAEPPRPAPRPKATPPTPAAETVADEQPHQPTNAPETVADVQPTPPAPPPPAAETLADIEAESPESPAPPEEPSPQTRLASLARDLPPELLRKLRDEGLE